MLNSTCLANGDVAQIKCLEPLFASVVSVVTSLAGILFFIMLLIGGFRYLLAGGDPKKIESAKGTLTAAILGLILIVSSYLILRLIEAFTGLDLTTFKVVTFP